MEEQFWVGILRGAGPIVYDPAIQDDESEILDLFVCNEQGTKQFERTKTKGKTKRITNVQEKQKYIALYETFKEDAQPEVSEEEIGIKVEDTETKKDISDEAVKDEVLESLQNILETREKEIELLSKEKEELAESYKKIGKELEEALAKIRQSQKPEEKSSSVEVLTRLSKNAAFFASGGNDHYKKLVLEEDLNIQLPIRIAAHLETRLRIGLDNPEPYVTLFDLISEAQEKELLNNDGIDMSHIIRKQRNVVAHHKSTQQEMTARIMVVLYAAAILWPQLVFNE